MAKSNKEPSYFKRMDAALGINQGSSGGGSSGGGSGTSSSSSTKKKKKEPAYFAEMDKRLGINQPAPEQPALEDFANANPLSATVQSLTNQRDAIATPKYSDPMSQYMQRRGVAELTDAIQNQTQRERAEALPRNPITGTVLSPIGKPPQSQQIHDLLVDAATKKSNPTADAQGQAFRTLRAGAEADRKQAEIDRQIEDTTARIGMTNDPAELQRLDSQLANLRTQRDDLTKVQTTRDDLVNRATRAANPAEADAFDQRFAEQQARTAEQQTQLNDIWKRIDEIDNEAGWVTDAEQGLRLSEEKSALMDQAHQMLLDNPDLENPTGAARWQAGRGSLWQGANTIARGFSNTVDMLFGDFAQEIWSIIGLGAYDNPIKAINKSVNEEGKAFQEYYSTETRGDKAAEALNKYGPQVVAALPAVAMAYATAGTSVATTAGLETTAYLNGLSGAEQTAAVVGNAIKTMSTDPNFMMSFTQEAGNAYSAAKEEGMDDAEAAVYSLLYGYVSGMVEVGGTSEIAGGLQQQAKEVVAGPKGVIPGLVDYAKSIVGEMGEEITQGMLERGLKSFFGVDTALYSTDPNQNAIISPAEMAEEAKGAALVSAVLGGPGAVTNTVNSVRENRAAQTEAPTETRAESPAETKAETPTETPAPAPAPTVEPTVTDTLVDVLQNSRNAETGQVTRKGIDTILADQALIDLFNENSDAKIDGKNNANNRAAIRDNADAVVAALTGTEVAENAPAAPAEPTVANNAPVENITENSQQSSTEQQEGINTPPEAETENVAETPQGETAETATAEAPETALATTPTEEIAPPESNPAGEVIDTETAQLPPAMKRSQTESNTLQSVAGVMGGEQDSLYYIPITEKQTLREAASRVRQDIGGEMEQLMAKEQWTAADIDTAMTIYGILQADGVRNHDFSAAQAWSRVIQPRGTATGQALQAFSKWSRTGQAVFSDAVTEISENPNLTEAQKTQILTDLQSFSDRFDTITQIGEDGEINVKDLRQLIQDLNKYRKTGTFNPKTFGKILDQIQDTEWLQEFALRQLMAARTDFSNNPSLAQRLKTWQVNSQLSRLGTFFRNIGGNMTFGIQDTLAQDFFGVAIDSLVSKKTGQREVAMDKGWLSSSARKSARNALLKSILEVSGDVDMTGEATRYGNTSSRTNKMSGNGFERFMSRWEQLLGYSLTSSDRFSRGQIETSVAEGLMRANGGNMTQEQAEAIAKQVADYRLFQNDGTAAQFSRSVHDALNKVGVKGPNGESFGLGDLLNPYPGVPANLGVKALEYSPANIIKGGLELHKILSDYKNGVEVETGRQNQAVMNMARGLSGAPAIALFALLFKKGVFKNADDEDDLDAKAQKTAEGQTGVQINLSAMKRTLQGESSDWKDGDDLMSLGWLEPLNAFLAIGSMVADSAEDESFWSMAKEYPQAYLEGSLQSIIDMPVMSNIKNMMDSYNYSNAEDIGGKIGDMALQGAGDAISGMIPAPVGQFAKATDPMQRSTKGDSDFETVVNGIISNIPGLRETLSPKLDAYGNEREYSGTDTQRWLNTFVLPGAINEYSQNNIQKLTDDLYESTGDAAVFPDRKPPSSLKFGSESVKLSTEQQDAYQKKAGETIQNLVDRTTHTSAWNTLTDEEKVSALDGIYKYGEYIAKKEFAEENGYKMSDSVYSKYEKLDDPAEGIIWNNRWSEATANGEQDYVAMDKVISEMNRMSDDVREMMENKDYVQKLEDASALGIGSRDFFITHDFLSGISKAVKEGTPLDYNAIDKGVQQYAKVVDSEEKADVFSSYFSKGDELAEAAKNGMGSEEWFKYYNKYKEVSGLTTDENGDKISANSKHDAFNNFVDMSDISPEQKEMLKGQFTFFTGYTVDDTTYDKMVRGGADPEAAYRWVQEQGDLVPTGDHKSVTSNQKAFVILNDKSLDPADRIEAILNTDGSVVKPNQGEMARWLNSNFSYSEAKYYWSQLQSKFGWSKKTSFEKALHK